MWLLHLILASVMCGVTSYDTKYLAEISNELEILEKGIRLSLFSGLNTMKQHLQQLRVKSSEVMNEAMNLIEEHTLEIAENLNRYDGEFFGTENNASRCSNDLKSSISEIHNEGKTDLKETVTDMITKSGSIITMPSIPMVVKIDNKTLQIKKRAEECALVNDEECLDSLLETINVLKNTAPSIIETIMTRLEMQLNIIESEIFSEVQKIVNAVVESYSDILFKFFDCTM